MHNYCKCSCDHHYRRSEGVLFQYPPKHVHEYEIVVVIDLLFLTECLGIDSCKWVFAPIHSRHGCSYLFQCTKQC